MSGTIKRSLSGEFTIAESKKGHGTMRVMDPNYTKEDYPRDILDVLPGRWLASVQMIQNEQTVESITVYHESLVGQSHDTDVYYPLISVGVDSGLAGFYDDTRFDEINDRRDELIALTSNELCAGCFDIGAVAVSGRGNGEYDLFVRISPTGIISAATISFIKEDEEDEQEVVEPEDQSQGDVLGMDDEREMH